MMRFLLAACLALAGSPAWAAWPSDGAFTAWGKCFKITLQASKISGALAGYVLDLDDMPPEFHAAAQSDLDDFRATSDGEAALDYFLDFYNPGTDQGMVWIDCPHAGSAASVDVDVYVYIGNPSASSTSTTAAMPSTMQARYMLQEEPTSDTAIKDTSGNARHSTNMYGSMTSGDLVSGGPHSGLKYITFDSNDRLLVPSAIFNACESAGAYTWTGWVNQRYEAANVGIFGSAGSQLQIRITTGGNVEAVSRNSGNFANFTASGSPLGGSTFETWCHVAVVYNGSTLKIYADGSERNSVSADSLRSADLSFFIGHDNTTYLRSWIMGVMMYSEALSGDQIATQHANETDSAFWAIEEFVPTSSFWQSIILSEE